MDDNIFPELMDDNIFPESILSRYTNGEYEKCFGKSLTHYNADFLREYKRLYTELSMNIRLFSLTLYLFDDYEKKTNNKTVKYFKKDAWVIINSATSQRKFCQLMSTRLKEYSVCTKELLNTIKADIDRIDERVNRLRGSILVEQFKYLGFDNYLNYLKSNGLTLWDDISSFYYSGKLSINEDEKAELINKKEYKTYLRNIDNMYLNYVKKRMSDNNLELIDTGVMLKEYNDIVQNRLKDDKKSKEKAKRSSAFKNIDEKMLSKIKSLDSEYFHYSDFFRNKINSRLGEFNGIAKVIFVGHINKNGTYKWGLVRDSFSLKNENAFDITNTDNYTESLLFSRLFSVRDTETVEKLINVIESNMEYSKCIAYKIFDERIDNSNSDGYSKLLNNIRARRLDKGLKPVLEPIDIIEEKRRLLMELRESRIEGEEKLKSMGIEIGNELEKFLDSSNYRSKVHGLKFLIKYLKFAVDNKLFCPYLYFLLVLKNKDDNTFRTVSIGDMYLYEIRKRANTFYDNSFLTLTEAGAENLEDRIIRNNFYKHFFSIKIIKLSISEDIKRKVMHYV